MTNERNQRYYKPYKAEKITLDRIKQGHNFSIHAVQRKTGKDY